MTSGPEPATPIAVRVADRLNDRLEAGGWRRHRFVPDDEVAFVRKPFNGVVFHFGVNLAGRHIVSLDSTAGVEHVAAAELQRCLYGRRGTVCQVGASMIDLIRGQEPTNVAPSRWWVASPEQVDEAVAQLVADLWSYGEPFLARHQTLSAVVDTLLGQPKSQVEYGPLAVCLAMLGDLPKARAMLAQFGAARQVFAGGPTETFIHNFTQRFGI
ncbi:hypothetical protein IW249_004270 [Micromonospora vinacea]|uniref:DUF4304 domain-containing protein n=1 Tax=Micromonospora vinacea TaxID=709878 RepID=A0ABS0K5G8_9ACTN|nr:hypothetical protein [Micromonospora vinacea]MBG6103856.1 hypothetical protein [Micromonospora vinacea]